MRSERAERSAYQGLVEEARICAYCGSCKAGCPTYAQIGWESASPRARVVLADRLVREGGREGFSEEQVRRALECTLCGNCRVACPAGIDTRRFLLELREEIRGADKDPEPFRQLASGLAARGNVSAFENATRADWLDEVDDSGVVVGEPAEVGYFVGCVASFYPIVSDIPESFARLFGRMGRTVAILGAEELCCGFPLIVAGREAEAEKLIRHNLKRVEALGVKTLVTGCPSCFHTWVHDYPKVAGGRLPFEVVTATQYLLRAVREGALDVASGEELDEVVTFHDPCDLGRNSGLYDEPRELLRSLPGVTLVEMAHHRENALCCGGGGDLQALEPELTKAVADRRIREAAETGASIVATACQQCVTVLREAARRNKVRVEVLDVIQLVLRVFE